MAALTALRPKVQPHVMGCPLPMIDDAILQTVIEFCNRSRAYRFTPGQITVVASTADYTVSDLPATTAIAWLLAAELDEVPIDTPDSGSIPVLWETETGSPSAVVVVSDTQVGLRTVPDAAGTLDLRLALRPSQSATTYPDEFHNLYQDQIAAGVLAKLYAQPRKDWSTPDLVKDCRDQFERAIYAAEYRADRGSANAPARTTLSLIGGH
jgi:hypothetical protein